MSDCGVVFRTQKYSIHDGPGIRTLVFLKGCPLRCLWCCNTESWNPNPEILFTKQKCIDCGKCIIVCPTKAIRIDETGNKTIGENCTLCLKCTGTCVTGALELVGKFMKATDVMEIIEQDRSFYDSSGGGVTLSGGEPTLQFRFSKELLKECKKRSISTAIETSGYCNRKNIEELSQFVDLFLYDIKVLNRTKHLLYTGVSNNTILENLEALAKLKKKITLRYPLIPQHNDGDEDIDALINFINALTSKYDVINELDLLPYHKYGLYKYALLGVDYKLKSLTSPSDREMEWMKEKLSKHLTIKIQVGG
jgi:pyruvate formate lyase activating enzyme